MLKQRRTVTQALAALLLLSLGSCATPIDRSQWVEKTAVVSVSYPCHMMGPDGHFGPGGLPWSDTVKVRLPNDWDSQDVLNRCISESRSNSHRPGFTHMVGECLRRGGYPVEDQAIHFDDKHTC